MKTRIKAFLLVLMLVAAACEVTEVNEITEVSNPVFSDTITIFEDDFVTDDEFISVAEYAWDILDVTTVDEGVVLGYIQFEGTTSWHALPLTVPFENDVVVLRYNFDVDTFNLIVEGEVANNNNANANLFDGDVLRIVAIPPDQISGKAKIDFSNYQEVATRFNLGK